MPNSVSLTINNPWNKQLRAVVDSLALGVFRLRLDAFLGSTGEPNAGCVLLEYSRLTSGLNTVAYNLQEIRLHTPIVPLF